MCGTGLPCGPKRLVVGRRARIVKLSSSQGQALNGQDCVVESYMDSGERYAVRVIDSSAVKALKPAGLWGWVVCGACQENLEEPKGDDA